MRAEEIAIPLPGGPLAARTWGASTLPPLLALHGWLDNAGSFGPMAPLLAQRWHVVALDLRGHGRSSHLPPGAWYHYTDALNDLHAVLDHFGWPRVDLLGHSLGGTLASLLAAALPERVGRLLLVEALGPLAATLDEALPRLREALEQHAAFGERRALRVFPTLDDAIAARMAVNGLSRAAARAIVERGVNAVEGGFSWSSDPRLMLPSARRYSEDQVLALLAGIRAPTTLVLAEPATPYLPAQMMEQRAARVRDIHVTRLAGHHHLHMEEPERVLGALLR